MIDTTNDGVGNAYLPADVGATKKVQCGLQTPRFELGVPVRAGSKRMRHGTPLPVSAVAGRRRAIRE